jgi:hypothetical protein
LHLTYNIRVLIMTLINTLRFFLKKWPLFLTIGIIAGGGGFLYATYQEPKFESRLTFSLDAGANDGILSGAMNLAAQFGLGVNSGQSMFEGDNILEIMKSRRMIESVLLSTDTFNGKKYSLIQFYLEQSGLLNIYRRKNHLKEINFAPGLLKKGLTYLQDSILNNVYNTISKENLSATRPDKKIGIYEVKFLSMNEKFSKIFTDRIVEETANFYTEITSKKDKETLEILEQRVASLKGDVANSIDIRASNQDANVNPAFLKAQASATKQQYNMQAYGEAYKEMFKTLEMARYQYLKKIPLLQIIDYADYPMKRIKVGRLRSAICSSSIALLITAILLLALQNYKSKSD